VTRSQLARPAPAQLRVVVRMRIDETRSDQLSISVDRLSRRLVGFPDGHNASLADTHVSRPRIGARAVSRQATCSAARVDHRHVACSHSPA